MLAWAQRIADGQWPYRDFWSNYAPGPDASRSPALTKLLGPSLLVVARRCASRSTRSPRWPPTASSGATRARRWALAAWVAVAGAMAFPTAPGPTPPALLLALRARCSPPAGGAVAGGVLAGLAFAFRPEVGLAAALGAVARGALGEAARPVRGRRRRAARAVRDRRAAATWPTRSSASRAMQGLQRLPLVPAPARRRRPEQAARAAVPAAARRSPPRSGRRGRCGGGPARRAAWALAPLVAVGLAYLLARADEFHLLPLSAALAVGARARGGGRARRSRRRPRSASRSPSIAAHGLERRAGAGAAPAAPGARARARSRTACRTTPADARALRRVLASSAAACRPGRPVLVAPPRFDRVRVGDPLLGVLLRRPNPTRYDVMQPGVVTTGEGAARDGARPRPAPGAGGDPLGGAGRARGASRTGRRARRACSSSTARSPPATGGSARYGDYVVLVRRAGPNGP